MSVGENKGGKNVLSSNSQVTNQGTIDVSNTDSGATGGQVKMLGQTVVSEGGAIDASGTAGGGEVLVGGNYQGAGDERAASLTYTSGTGQVFISGGVTTEGQAGQAGGNVQIVTTEVVQIEGVIDASGGAAAGGAGLDGGNVTITSSEAGIRGGGVDVSDNDAAEVIPSLTASFFSSPITVDTLGAADVNSDGMLSRQEIIWYAGGDSAEVDALFASLDTNGDGYISRSELKKK